MQRWIAFIAILLVSAAKTFACGPFYPYGEDIRFTLFNDTTMGYDDFGYFKYSARLFALMSNENGDTTTGMGINMNIKAWQQYCRNQVPAGDISEAVYDLPAGDLHDPNTANRMLLYLRRCGDTDAINYIGFAKECELYNKYDADPWERNDNLWTPRRAAMITRAQEKIARLHNEELKKRYAFLAIRLAFYNADTSVLGNLYRDNFKGRKNLDIIDYWAMHFRAMTERNHALQNYYVARVFAHAPDKRFELYQQYTESVPLAATLRYARNNRERAEVYAMDAFRNPARALHNLEQVYRLQPASREFSVLLQREMDKLEDWIYTPYYTNFLSGLTDGQYELSKKGGFQYLLARRVARDRQYAGELLQFLNRINISRTENPALCRFSKAYLHLMHQDYAACISGCKELQQHTSKNGAIYMRARLVEALCLTAQQPAGKATVPVFAKNIILDQYEQKNSKFVFAIARELEYKGNTTTAALLLAKVAPDAGYNMWWPEGPHVNWRTRKGYNTLLMDFYDNYFFYLDAQYTPGQMKQLISSVTSFKPSRADSFSRWMYEGMSGSATDRLYDLLGTKYIRKNELANAASAFNKINDTLWTSERFKGYRYLDANPFYTDMYNEHFRKAADSTKFNKLTITKQLISYLAAAADPHEKRRECDYFLAANCYLNMTQNGNSWMMRRYFWTSRAEPSKLEDDAEYYNCNLAKQYYLKAKSVTKSRKFAALCLRMAGRCEKYRLYRTLSDDQRYRENADEMVFKMNKYYSQLKRQYPGYYDDLISNCTMFNDYFMAAK